MNMENTVVVVGSGMMGSGIGAMAALAGRRTILTDLDADRVRLGRDRAVSRIRLREENGLASSQQAQRALSLLEYQEDVEHAVRRASLVFEAISEDLAAKQALFLHLDTLLPPDVPMRSNTSGLASAEDVDTAISCGMAMRFPEWGSLMHLDAIGL